MKRITAIIVFLVFLAPSFLSADTVYFDNGGSIEGIIKSEDADNVQMDIGFGTITCPKREIKKIERSSPEEAVALTEKWEAKRQELKKSEEEFNLERQRRFAEYDEWMRQERERSEREARAQGTIDLARDYASSSILVGAVLNDKVNATLVLDTGASIVVLTKQKGEELGIDLTPTGNNLATLQLAGNHRALAKMVILKSVRINDIEVKDVLTGILLDDAGAGFRDGLLGMTFLSRFNLKIDLKNMKLSLEKAG
ncbi:MAG: retropepsin-like aspartic protease [Candidatus Omnitrophica bacterium]|nr:retropepsin-like aspartic protease [Candidatus Omnitrophota bacterium]